MHVWIVIDDDTFQMLGVYDNYEAAKASCQDSWQGNLDGVIIFTVDEETISIDKHYPDDSYPGHMGTIYKKMVNTVATNW